MSDDKDKADKVGEQKPGEQTGEPEPAKKDGDGKDKEFGTQFSEWLKTLPNDEARKTAKALPDDTARKAAMELNAKLVTAFGSVKTERNDFREQVEKYNKAQETALEENKEFETLATSRKTELDELKPQVETLTTEKTSLTEQLEAANEAISKWVESEKQALGLDEPMLALLKDKPPVDQLGFLAAHREKLGKGKPGGIPAVPDGKNKGPLTHEEKLALTAPVIL